VAGQPARHAGHSRLQDGHCGMQERPVTIMVLSACHKPHPWCEDHLVCPKCHKCRCCNRPTYKCPAWKTNE
jgi:hypothetical protein